MQLLIETRTIFNALKNSAAWLEINITPAKVGFDFNCGVYNDDEGKIKKILENSPKFVEYVVEVAILHNLDSANILYGITKNRLELRTDKSTLSLFSP